jgi:hypothetical protein
MPVGGGTEWRLDGISITGTGARWITAQIQDGQDVTWHCANELRLQNNVMYHDQECQYGNGSPMAAQMADMTASRIPS